MDAAEAVEARGQLGVIEVWPDNAAIFELWSALDTRWELQIGLTKTRWASPSHADAESAMRLLGVKKRDRRRLFNELCQMEIAALNVLNGAEETIDE